MDLLLLFPLHEQHLHLVCWVREKQPQRPRGLPLAAAAAAAAVAAAPAPAPAAPVHLQAALLLRILPARYQGIAPTAPRRC